MSTASTLSNGTQHASEWPASDTAMHAARAFLKQCASDKSGRILLVPDKDADGLCASMIIYRTLLKLGSAPHLISAHFVEKGSNVHCGRERDRMEAYDAKHVVVVDQGSRAGGPLVRGEDVKTLIVDHHWTDSRAEDYPEDALVLSAAHHPPVATSSMLAYMLCRPLIGENELREVDYLCLIGTYGDLGTSFDFRPAPAWPREEMQACIRRCTKTVLTRAVGLLNAPRRTATYDVHSAWAALLETTTSPSPLLHSTRLQDARTEVNDEVQRVSRSRPYFSGDGRVALVRVTSGAQVHPVIATRWAASLKSKKLEVVMCANDGYLAGMTNFSCRVAKCAGRHEEEVNVIEILNEYARREDGLREAMGDNFARGHKEASGGIVRTEHFERLWGIMPSSAPTEEGGGSGLHGRKRRKTENATFPAQKNTLDRWLKH